GARRGRGLLLHEIFGRRRSVGEDGLSKVARLVHEGDRAHGDVGRLYVHEREGDAVLALFRLGVGTHEAEGPVAVVPERGPDLLAGDEVRITVAHGARLERGQVGAGTRLGVALHAQIVAVV